jgi:serine phosphatase RsbU (regulator of sigma subunit)/cell division septum initiation protein DivIVA
MVVERDQPVRPVFELVGDALDVALDARRTPREIARLAADLTGAPASILWQWEAEGEPLTASGAHGVDAEADLEPARVLAEQALALPGSPRTLVGGLPQPGCDASTAVTIGRPPTGVLQLLHPATTPPGAEQREQLTTFAVRAASALRAGARALRLELELERARAVLALVGQATSELSVSHTLEIAVDRVAELLDVERVAVYLRAPDDGTLTLAAARGSSGRDTQLAERLLKLALRRVGGRSVVDLVDVSRDPRLREAAQAERDAGVGGVLAVPLLVHGESIGLLVAYPGARREHDENDAELLVALAGQLAVAVQNAQLHEQATRLGEEREAALRSERAAARRLRSIYEVSRSFAQSLSLDETLQALARTVADVLDLDAAAILMPDERRELLVTRASHVTDVHLAEPVGALLARPAPFDARSVQEVFGDARLVRVDARTAAELGAFSRALSPFLELGWTAALVPVAIPGEVIAALAIISCRPESPVSDETVEAAVAIVGQAALAIDNARLYQQQKRFADTMQRSLLPRVRPDVVGLEAGEAYESSARLDVGGDLYDVFVLADGRLAAMLGDVTGHGVEATADMAMARYVFRTLAREHPEPGELLAAANDVVLGELAPGKFITLTYLVADGTTGAVACASAGHPAPRLLLPDGRTTGLGTSGLALGIDAGQVYEETRVLLPSGAALVLYTDGVVEARRDGRLYGVERLDALLAERCELPARALASAVAEDARAFAGGDLTDDLAVVVIRRTS